MSEKIYLIVGAGQDSQAIQKAIKQLTNQGFEVETKPMEETVVIPNIAMANLEQDIKLMSKAESELSEELCRLSEELCSKKNKLAELTKIRTRPSTPNESYESAEMLVDAVKESLYNTIINVNLASLFSGCSFQEAVEKEADNIAAKIEAEVRQEEMNFRFNDIDAVTHDIHTMAANILEKTGLGSEATLNDAINFSIQSIGKALGSHTYSEEAYQHLTNAAANIVILMGRMRSGDVANRFYEDIMSGSVTQEG